jgi:hypothetical protein
LFPAPVEGGISLPEIVHRLSELFRQGRHGLGYAVGVLVGVSVEGTFFAGHPTQLPEKERLADAAVTVDVEDETLSLMLDREPQIFSKETEMSVSADKCRLLTPAEDLL